MNRDQLQGRVRQIVGAFREQWGKLIADQTLQMRGERDQRMARGQMGRGRAEDLARDREARERRADRR